MEEADNKPVPPHVKELVDEVLKLNLFEIALLTQALKKKLGVSDAQMYGGGGGGGGGGAVAAAAGGDAVPAEEVKEQTEFAVKLVSFDAKAKIKVIKEVRAIAELGLKEVRSMCFIQ